MKYYHTSQPYITDQPPLHRLFAVNVIHFEKVREVQLSAQKNPNSERSKWFATRTTRHGKANCEQQVWAHGVDASYSAPIVFTLTKPHWMYKTRRTTRVH